MLTRRGVSGACVVQPSRKQGRRSSRSHAAMARTGEHRDILASAVPRSPRGDIKTTSCRVPTASPSPRAGPCPTRRITSAVPSLGTHATHPDGAPSPAGPKLRLRPPRPPGGLSPERLSWTSEPKPTTLSQHSGSRYRKAAASGRVHPSPLAELTAYRQHGAFFP